ncbi:MAG: response regulator, partial [Chloroflexota bacterium]|nr:response regulator [Chloroflexota bacterium]
AQNGKEALRLFYENHPDLLIADIRMPVMDGLDAQTIE